MFCGKCGAKNIDAAKFCEKCGAPMVSNAPFSVAKQEQKMEIVANNSTYAPKMEFKLSKRDILIFLELVLIIALAYGGKLIADKYYTPTYVAEQYFETLMEGDLGKAYDFLNVKDSEFLSKDMFVKTYRVKSRGKLGAFYAQEKKRDQISATVEITYRLENGDKDKKKEIVLQKKGTKKFFFFDEWEVSLSDGIVKDIPVYVPSEAEVWLDDIKLDEKEWTEEFYDAYCIKEAFAGTHTLKVTKPGSQTVVRNIVLDSEGEYDESLLEVEQMYLEEETLQQINNHAQTAFKKIMDTKARNLFPSFIEVLVTDPDGLGYTKDCYRRFLTLGSDYVRVKDIKVVSTDCDIWENSSDINDYEQYYDEGEDEAYILEPFHSKSNLIVAKAELSCTCIYEDSYGYEDEKDIEGTFYYGYVDGALSLLAVKLVPDGYY